MQRYVADLIATGDFPQLTKLVQGEGTAEVWAQLTAHSEDPTRFDRNLARLIDGIQRDLQRR